MTELEELQRHVRKYFYLLGLEVHDEVYGRLSDTERMDVLRIRTETRLVCDGHVRPEFSLPAERYEA